MSTIQLFKPFSSKLDLFIYKRAWWVLIISGLLMLALGEYTNIDLLIEDYYYDSTLHTFPWRDSWFAADLMHGYLKNVIVKSGYLLFLFVLIDWIKPWKKIHQLLRFKLRFVAVAAILIPLAVMLIKHYSVLHCPWDIDRYGGTASFLRLLDHIPAGMQPGRCFPAAHATVGIWLTALCIFWLPHNPKAATWVFVMGLALGFVLGWVQQMRGAHFLFHTLWTMWIASFIILLMLQTTFSKWNKDIKSSAF